MEHVKRADHDTVYKGEHAGPDGTVYNEGVGDLSCKRVTYEDGSVAIVAHYAPDLEDLHTLQAGGHVEIAIFQEPIPPIAMAAVAQCEEDTSG